MPDLAPFALYNVSPFADMQGQQVTVRRPDFGMAKQSHVEALDFQAVAGWVFADHKPAGIAPSEDDDFSIEVLGGGEARPQDVRPSTDRGGSFAYGVYRHFCLNVVSVDATVAELRARGVTMVADPFVVEETSRRPTFVADHSAILSSLPR